MPTAPDDFSPQEDVSDESAAPEPEPGHRHRRKRKVKRGSSRFKGKATFIIVIVVAWLALLAVWYYLVSPSQSPPPS